MKNVSGCGNGKIGLGFAQVLNWEALGMLRIILLHHAYFSVIVSVLEGFSQQKLRNCDGKWLQVRCQCQPIGRQLPRGMW